MNQRARVGPGVVVTEPEEPSYGAAGVEEPLDEVRSDLLVVLLAIGSAVLFVLDL